jgi:hypothetical protein
MLLIVIGSDMSPSVGVGMASHHAFKPPEMTAVLAPSVSVTLVNSGREKIDTVSELQYVTFRVHAKQHQRAALQNLQPGLCYALARSSKWRIDLSPAAEKRLERGNRRGLLPGPPVLLPRTGTVCAAKTDFGGKFMVERCVCSDIFSLR